MNTLLKNEIIDYATNNPDKEICGFIYYDKIGNSFIKKCDNIHKDKYNYFEISSLDFITLSSNYEIFGIFHSHTGEECEFTKSDINLSEEYQIPIYMYNFKIGVWREYMPKSVKFNLTGNPFSWGLFDCYTVLRLYYWKKYNYLFEDYDRCKNFNGMPDNNNNKTIEERLIDLGFIAVNDLQDGDIVLSQNIRSNYSHINVYEDGFIFNHKLFRLSEKEFSFIDINKVKIFRNESVTKYKV